jgi:hypothetical protein
MIEEQTERLQIIHTKALLQLSQARACVLTQSMDRPKRAHQSVQCLEPLAGPPPPSSHCKPYPKMSTSQISTAPTQSSIHQQKADIAPEAMGSLPKAPAPQTCKLLCSRLQADDTFCHTWAALLGSR